MTQEESRLEAASSRLEAAVAHRRELEARLARARSGVRKAEAYHEIMNLMSAHVHCCMNQEYEAELKRFWSRREDIVYANGDIAYTGRKAVYRYYVEDSRERSLRTRKLLNLPEDRAGESLGTPGYININLVGTPYIEVAEDGRTAQGIWMACSFMSSLDGKGESSSQGVLSRYSGEFILEDGEWKIWHRRNYADVVFQEDPVCSSAETGEGFPLAGPCSAWGGAETRPEGGGASDDRN